MSPDKPPAPSLIRRDTQALQPPPLIPSHPAGLWGRCHNVVMIPQLWLLVSGGDDGGVERRKRGDKRRGNKPQQDPQELSPIYLHLLFCILLATHCRSWAKNRHLSTNQCVFQTKRAEVNSKNNWPEITDGTNLSSASPCVELSDILSMIWGSHCAFSPEATTI